MLSLWESTQRRMAGVWKVIEDVKELNSGPTGVCRMKTSPAGVCSQIAGQGVIFPSKKAKGMDGPVAFHSRGGLKFCFEMGAFSAPIQLQILLIISPENISV